MSFLGSKLLKILLKSLVFVTKPIWSKIMDNFHLLIMPKYLSIEKNGQKLASLLSKNCKNFCPFNAGSNYATNPKMTPIRAGVKKADKVCDIAMGNSVVDKQQKEIQEK